jgi:hypothetical protein
MIARGSLTRAVVSIVVLALTLPGRALAQDGRNACPAGERVPALGVDRLICIGGSCSINVDTDEGVEHRFSTEPRVDAVSGAARGVLKPGDVVVAIDGLPITTREGGRRFANPLPGEPARLTVRRGGKEIALAIVPEPGCRTGALDVRTGRGAQ